MRNKRRCVWSQNYLWAKRRPASRKTIRNSQPDTTILHSPTPFRKNPKNFWPLTGQNRPKWHMQSGYDMMIKSYRHIRMKGFRRMYQWYGLNYHSWRKYVIYGDFTCGPLRNTPPLNTPHPPPHIYGYLRDYDNEKAHFWQARAVIFKRQKIDMTSAPWVLANMSTSGRGIWVTGDEAKQGDLPLNGAGETN